MIISLGSLNLDVQVRVERWPGPGETLPASEFLVAGGGKAANVALLARKLGAPSMLLASAGDDAFAEMACAPLKEAGVDLAHVRRARDCATAVALIAVRPDGEKAIMLAGNANERWTEEDAAAAEAAIAVAPEGSVLVADLEVPLGVVKRIARRCRDRGFVCVLDPSPASAMQAELYALFDCITPNPGEAAALAGFPVRSEEEALRAGRRLQELGARTALVKLADGGCVMVGEEHALRLRAPAVEAFDKTGAGDAFAGALAVGLLRGKPVAEAARLAVAAAAIAVTRYGSQASYPDKAELERLAGSVKER